ncbi:MAG: leucyl aminopeptidase [Isosphaeraceae bacterium]
MTIQFRTHNPATFPAEWLVVGLAANQAEPPREIRDTPAGEAVRELLRRGDLGTGLGEATPILGAGGLAAKSLMVVGLGPREDFRAGAAFGAGVAVARKLAGKPRDSVAVTLNDLLSAPELASALVEGLVVGQRGPDLRKAEKSRHEFRELTILSGSATSEAELKKAVHRGEMVGQAVNLARHLVNTPPSEKPPARLAARAREIAEDCGLAVSVHHGEWLQAERFGGVLGVSAGSDEPPAFVRLEHRRGGDAPAIALIGKGVTFDSGGLSLKPSASMEDMKSDMTGAAVVLATMQAVARLGLPVNVVAMFALVENMTGGRAMKLGDVLAHRNGKTVEVLNTDAEGRLVLADILAYASEQQPGLILDLATLTGACMVALGTRIAGLFANDDALADRLLAACRATGERAWRLPMDEDFRDQLKSNVADLKNVGGKWGGAITAAKFLEQFVGKVPWAHLDIAGPSWADGESSMRDAGGTGCFVRTLVRFLEGEVKA